MRTEQQMKAKWYLQQAFKINELITSKIEELNELKILSTSLPSTDFSQERVQKTKSLEAKFTKYVISIVDLEKKIDEEMAQLMELKIEIREKIHQVEDSKRRIVLQYRYMNFMKWEEIAKKMSYSIKQLHRIHNDALTDISVFIS
ncbi:MAG: DUF1492 domain-containing protein [Eubacteriales bacterium]|nr:DUF1492 domain-containing protein [Eubacteriales bacterium]